MAQSGYTPILVYASGTATNVPLAANLTSSASGAELALNYADMKLYAKNSSGVVTLLASAAGASGSVTSVAATVPSFLSISGSPITTSGTLAITLSGTALPTTSGGTGLTSFTANGVVYASSSSALTTGSALTFDGTTLTNTRNTTDGTSAALTLNNSGATGSYATLNLNAGSVTYQQFADAAGNAIGTAGVMFRTTSNHPLVWGINATEQMRLNSTGLGIGTSSPGFKLDVNGTAGFAGVTAFNGGANTLKNTGELQWKDSGGTAQNVLFMFSDNNVYLSSPVSSSSLIFRGVGFAERARIDSSGNLGLGVTPSAWNSSARAIDIGANSAVFNASNNASIGNNVFLNASSQWIYKNTAAAALYDQSTGSHRWFNAPSGTAGNAITFTQAMTLDVSGNLIVGGTSNPYAVANRGIVQSNGTSSAMFGLAVNSVAAGYWISNGSQMTIGAPAGHPILFDINGERMRLDSSGNLGLGVTPSAWGTFKSFDLFSSLGASLASTGGTMQLGMNFYYNGSSYIYKGTGSATRYEQFGGGGGTSSHSWYTAPSGTAGNAISFTQAMTLDASGNLGVGTTTLNTGSYGKSITVAATASAYGGVEISGTTGGALEFQTSQSTRQVQLLGNSSGFIINVNNGSSLTERARITSGGDFVVGDTSTITGARMSVVGNVADMLVRLKNTNTTAPSGLDVHYSGAATNNTANWFYLARDSGANRFYVYSNGGIANYQANDANLSDRREKTNFAPAKSYLDTICAIPVQTFNYIDQSEDDPGLTLGVVAQDVQAVAPELVIESNWGTEDNPKMRLSIYQTDLQYALMKAFQELKAEFDAYKATHP